MNYMTNDRLKLDPAVL